MKFREFVKDWLIRVRCSTLQALYNQVMIHFALSGRFKHLLALLTAEVSSYPSLLLALRVRWLNRMDRHANCMNTARERTPPNSVLWVFSRSWLVAIVCTMGCASKPAVHKLAVDQEAIVTQQGERPLTLKPGSQLAVTEPTFV